MAHHLRLRQAEATVAAAVAPLGRVLRPAEQRALLVHRLLSLRELCVRAGAVLDAVARLRGLLVALPADVRPPTEGLPAVGRVVATARRLAGRSSADLARRELGDVVARLSSGSLPSEQAPELRMAVAALRRLDVAGYAAAVEAVDAARDEQRDLRRSDTLAARLVEWPGLLEALDADTSDETWEPRERRWAQAWAHRRATAWLTHVERPDSIVTTAALRPRTGADLLVVGPVDEGTELRVVTQRADGPRREVLLPQEPLRVEVLGGLEDPPDLADGEHHPEPDPEGRDRPGEPEVRGHRPDDGPVRLRREPGGQDGEGELALGGLGRVVAVVLGHPRHRTGAGRGGQHGVEGDRGETGREPDGHARRPGRGARRRPGDPAADPGGRGVHPVEGPAGGAEVVDVEAPQVGRAGDLEAGRRQRPEDVLGAPGRRPAEPQAGVVQRLQHGGDHHVADEVVHQVRARQPPQPAHGPRAEASPPARAGRRRGPPALHGLPGARVARGHRARGGAVTGPDGRHPGRPDRAVRVDGG